MGARASHGPRQRLALSTALARARSLPCLTLPPACPPCPNRCSCLVYDCGSRTHSGPGVGNPRALWVGLEFVRYAYTKVWLGPEAAARCGALCRGGCRMHGRARALCALLRASAVCCHARHDLLAACLLRSRGPPPAAPHALARRIQRDQRLQWVPEGHEPPNAAAHEVGCPEWLVRTCAVLCHAVRAQHRVVLGLQVLCALGAALGHRAAAARGAPLHHAR